jgi:hypothetical protein
MTESEWLACRNPDDLYFDRFYSNPKPMRKLRLFACGCCRLIWEHIRDPRSRAAVEAAELYADELITDEALNNPFDAAEEASDEIEARIPKPIDQGASMAAKLTIQAPSDVAHPVAWVLAHAQAEEVFTESLKRNLATLADVFRDVFGNPFRMPHFNNSWLAPEVQALARLIYDTKDFTRMPELARVLEAAGCGDQEFLNHCASQHVHVKGCWVLDQLLGKSQA